ncbi:MAG TPA: WD40 repeat domain-containing protein, partial [Kofleriaceae bacterium]|nr:WD40 repeat domain-containing protein [Kofleriaceae bacterium]
ARELADDLRRFTTGQLVSAHQYSVGERARRWLRKHRAVATVSALALAALAAFGVWSFRRISDERDTAISRAREAIENGNRATLAQARGALARDPAEALAWLARLDPDGPGWPEARVLAADAQSRPRLLERFEIHPGGTMDWISDRSGSRLLGSAADRLVVVDVAHATVQTLHSPESSSAFDWTFCDDGVHAYGTGMTIDLSNGQSTPHAARDHDEWLASQRCNGEHRFDRSESGTLFWWDDRAHTQRTLADAGIADMVETDDHQHAITVDGARRLTWWDPEHDQHVVLEGLVPDGTTLADSAITADGRRIVFGEPQIVQLGVEQPPISIERSSKMIAISPDGTLLAFVEEGKLHVRGGRYHLVDLIETALPGKTFLVFFADGWLVALGEPTVMWEMKTLTQIEPEQGPTSHAIWMPNDHVATWDSSGSLSVWAFEPPRVLARAHLVRAAMSPSGRWVAADEDGVAHRIDLQTGSDEHLAQPSYSIELGPVAIDDDGAVALAPGSRLWWWPARGPAVQIGADRFDSPTLRGSRGAAVAFTPTSIDEIDAHGARRIWPRTSAPALEQRGAAANLRWIALIDPADAQRALRVVEVASGREVAIAGAVGDVVAFSDDGRWLAAPAMSSSAIVVWDLDAGRGRTIKIPIDVRHLMFSRDDRSLAIASESSLAIVDLERDAARSLGSGPESIDTIAFDASGDRLVTTGEHDVWLWDLVANEGRRVMIGPAATAGFYGTRLIVVSNNAILQIDDELPRDPRALSYALRALPYEIDESAGAAARVRMRR